MTKTILGADKSAYVKKMNINKAICIVVACLTVGLNVLFTLLRTDKNHLLMLILNIVVDVAAGWFLVYFVSRHVLFRQNVLHLHGNGNKLSFRGQITSISTQTQKVQGFDCYQITVGQQDARIFFLPTCFNVQLAVDSVVTFAVTSNIIVEVTL